MDYNNKILSVKPSKLVGKVRVSGAKNSALRLLAASILTEEDVFLTNFPNGLSDIKIHIDMLKVLGKTITIKDDTIKISETELKSELIWERRSIRNTLLIWGALLARTGKSKVPLPGGCQIGNRKYDLHQMVLEKLGAKVYLEGNYLCAEAPNGIRGAEIYLPFRSRGATENTIITASLANKGKTILWNPYIRPEIIDLVKMINKMGGEIKVSGNEKIEIGGVKKLKKVNYEVIPDNIEGLTYLLATAVTKGEVEIENIPTNFLEVPLIYLKECGVSFFEGSESMIVKGGKYYPFEISTGIYPGIDSDMQPLFSILGIVANGRSSIVDLRYPNRFAYADELKKMNAFLSVEDNKLTIEGGKILTGTDVTANDLRAGAALLIAGLVAEGTTKIYNAEQIERGYEKFYEKFSKLGAKISWVT